MRRGFTLLELMMVVIVVGILASLALPRFIAGVEKAKISEAKNILGAIRSSQFVYYAENGRYQSTQGTNDMGNLDIRLTTSQHFNYCSRSGGGTACPGADYHVASAHRKNGPTYTLCIREEGTIDCQGADCSDVGY